MFAILAREEPSQVRGEIDSGGVGTPALCVTRKTIDNRRVSGSKHSLTIYSKVCIHRGPKNRYSSQNTLTQTKQFCRVTPRANSPSANEYPYDRADARLLL